MDTVSFRTLGGGAAHDTDLGARTPQRHGHHDLAGGYGAWGSHLGFGNDDSRSKLPLSFARLFQIKKSVLFFRKNPTGVARSREQPPSRRVIVVCRSTTEIRIMK